MQAPSPIFSSIGPIAASGEVTNTAGTAFDNPASVTAGSESGTPTTVTSNEITVAAGQRVVLRFTQQRGSSGSPGDNRTLASITGTDDFAGIDDGDMTAHEGAVQRDDANQGGVGVYIYSWQASLDGTGSFTVAWSGSVWATMCEATVLPPCEVIDSAIAGGNNAATSAAPALAGTPDANDLVLSVCAVRADTAFNVPTNFTGETNFSGASTNRQQTAYDNGGAAQTTTWSGLSSSHPCIAANIQLRRT